MQLPAYDNVLLEILQNCKLIRFFRLFIYRRHYADVE